MTQRVISFHYTLTGPDGNVIDSSRERGALSYIEGSGQIIPGLERELKALQKGDKRTINVPAASAYGERHQNLVIKLHPDKLPSKSVKPGDRFSGGPEAHAPVFVVISVTETEVTLDGNHSLAGMDLTFDVEMTGVREATADELSHGHAHGEHGHSH